MYLQKTREILLKEVKRHKLLDEEIEVISARSLRPEEAIGSPERDDYPILKGKEVMIEANFKGSRGQAFTDHPGTCTRRLKDIFEKDAVSRFDYAVLIASMNAIAAYLGMVDKTVHCKNEQPKKCADHLVDYIKERYDQPKIAFIGYQPGMIHALSKNYEIRVVDLDPDNIGKAFKSVIVEDVSKTDEIMSWCDIILATGSTSVNGTFMDFINDKPVIFYGVTVSAIAQLNGLQQYCHLGN